MTASFSIAGFPCSGMDWLGRLVSLHPAITVADPPDRLGPLGRAPGTTPPLEPAAPPATHGAAGGKPGVTHLGRIVVAGTGTARAPEFQVLRDGRDVLVAWTIRQLRAEGLALRRFLATPGEGSRMPELYRCFRADPAEVLERRPGLLLADYDWVRYGAHLWDEAVSAYFGTLGAIEDGRIEGPTPTMLRYEVARADPLAALNAVAGELGLDPMSADALGARAELIGAGEPDAALREEWAIGRWTRYFTPRASRLFRLEAEQSLEHLTDEYGDEWEGECAPEPE